jgi:hypothetical protein
LTRLQVWRNAVWPQVGHGLANSWQAISDPPFPLAGSFSVRLYGRLSTCKLLLNIFFFNK